MTIRLFCEKCKTLRKYDVCPKCGLPCRPPHADWEEPKMPPVDKIRALAREVGYAIGIHGTEERDLDLIAAPWSEAAVGNHDLIKHLAEGLGAFVLEVTRKPLGRYAATIQIDGWYKAIDLTVCPIARPAPDGWLQKRFLAGAARFQEEWGQLMDVIWWDRISDRYRRGREEGYQKGFKAGQRAEREESIAGKKAERDHG